MGKRTNPKYLRYLRQRSGLNRNLKYPIYGNPNYPKGGYFLTDDNRVISKGRKHALLQAQLYIENQSHTISECAYIKVINKHYPFGIKRFFSGPKHFFEDVQIECTLRSIVYSTKELAMQAFNNNRITWIERLPPHDPG